jgi:hypothetical protein
MSMEAHTSHGRQATLHVFSESGAWHWGISIPRERGGGFQVMAYNTTSFIAEMDAFTDGSLALERFARAPQSDAQEGRKEGASVSSGKHREYMRERLRCAMARLVRSDGIQAAQATKWANAWGALIGEQHFDEALRGRTRTDGPST